MSTIVTLADAKLHLRVTHSDEDTIIQKYVDAADSYIRKVLNEPNIPADPAIQEAAFLLIGGMYEQRSDKIVGTIVADNPAVMNMLHPFRKSIGI
jgi:hypothetical protein